MKKIVYALALASVLFPSAGAFASEPGRDEVKQEKPSHLKLYGFIRNYFTFDTRESKAGTKDLFYYIPKDESLNKSGEDINANPTFRYLAITSRVGLDVKDYQFNRTKVSAKIEADFYCMNGNVAVLRLRQAYATLLWDDLGSNDRPQSVSLKLGQAWHPVAADQPYVIDLETGTPFNAFNRTPMAMVDYNVTKSFTLSGALLWQMQYLSTGPSGASDDYMKHGCTPELYVGATFKNNNGFTGRVGADVLSIKPRWRNEEDGKSNSGDKVSDRITTVSPYVYAQYVHKDFSVNGKVIYASAGEHFNMLSGYGVTQKNADGSWEYSPLQSVASFVSVKYGRRVQVQGMLGYFRNLGASASLIADKQIDGKDYTSTKNVYISSNGFNNLNRIVRFTPTVVYNLGKLSFGLEYDLTSAQYGKYAETGYVSSATGLADQGLHWVTNHRILGMVKFSF